MNQYECLPEWLNSMHGETYLTAKGGKGGKMLRKIGIEFNFGDVND